MLEHSANSRLSLCAVDNPDTELREDAFMFRNKPGGFDLYVASAVPPIDFIKPNKLDKAIKKNLEGKIPTPLFRDWQNYRFSLKGECSQPAIVVCYKVNSSSGVESVDVTVGTVRLGRIFTYEEYDKSIFVRDDFTRMAYILDDIQVPYLGSQILTSRIERRLSTDVVRGVLALFNHACRSAALKAQIPFVGLQKDQRKGRYFAVNPNWAIYNRPFRYPAAFINATNLVRYLQGKEPILSYAELKSFFPG